MYKNTQIESQAGQAPKTAADVLTLALDDWHPRIYDPAQEGSEYNPFYRHILVWSKDNEVDGDLTFRALSALYNSVPDGFEYHEAMLVPDFEAVGNLVLKTAEILEAS